mmetsp:Transcript_22574/g.30919  ORF Transcript_22574/g.30919 Transcript_22574/m.30919 type:complete len:228 (-) Transcript_22574:771-1454(-)
MSLRRSESCRFSGRHSGGGGLFSVTTATSLGCGASTIGVATTSRGLFCTFFAASERLVPDLEEKSGLEVAAGGLSAVFLMTWRAFPATCPIQPLFAGCLESSAPELPWLMAGLALLEGALRIRSAHTSGAACSSRLRSSADWGCSARAFSALLAAASVSPSRNCSSASVCRRRALPGAFSTPCAANSSASRYSQRSSACSIKPCHTSSSEIDTLSAPDSPSACRSWW